MLTCAGVLQCEVLILKLVPIDALAARAVVVGEVASLAHEAGNDAVERAAFVAKTLLTGAQRPEVLYKCHTIPVNCCCHDEPVRLLIWWNKMFQR